MKFSQSLLFLSPVPWDHPNRQTQDFALKLALTRNVFFLYTYSIRTIGYKDLLYKKSERKKLSSILNQVTDNNQTLIKEMMFVTSKRYRQMEEFSNVDSLLFDIQLKLYIYIAQKRFTLSNCILWVNTSYFPRAFYNFKAKKIFFDFYDRIFDFLYPENDHVYRKNEKWIVKNSDQIFITSNYYKNVLKKLNAQESKIVKVPVGYNLSKHLEVNKKFNKKKRLTVGYAGTITVRLKFDLIEKVVQSHPNIDFIFVGPIEDKAPWLTPKPKISVRKFISGMCLYQNFTYLESQENIEDQISVVQTFDIGWIPYDLEVLFNYFCNPTKFYEYTAIGLPVISTKIPALKDYKQHLYFIETVKDFKEAIVALTAEPQQQRILERKKIMVKQNIDEKYKAIQKFL